MQMTIERPDDMVDVVSDDDIASATIAAVCDDDVISPDAAMTIGPLMAVMTITRAVR